MNEIEVRITQLENNMNTLLSVRRTEDERNRNKTESNEKSLNETNKNIVETTAELEETAITVADFLAEYYLSQLGIDDFNMEGGEEE